jgi:hypothetical protein
VNNSFDKKEEISYRKSKGRKSSVNHKKTDMVSGKYDKSEGQQSKSKIQFMDPTPDPPGGRRS